MRLISVSDVYKSYPLGQTMVPALQGVSLDIDENEFVAVVGPSGSGKSTLLNLIGIVDHPTSGKVLLHDQDLSELNDDQRTRMRNHHIGFVFQRFNLIPVLTALENVALPLEIEGRPAREIDRRAREMLERVGLESFAEHRPDQLSGGQQQRVAIARALVIRPSLVIADEPTANLDTVTAQTVMDLMRELNETLSTTFVFSTHDQRLLRQVKRLIHLDDGRLSDRTLPS
jgi:putative ABC transport system ATP-binding protein